MELTQLKYFLTVVNCGKVVDAAEMLHVSQSAVSMAISRLEQELGAELFERKGHRIQLTSYGSMFVNMITPAIADLDFAKKQIRNAQKREPDAILLSVEMPDFATTLERIYLKINPQARFRQAMDTTEIAAKKLQQEKVDFCIAYEPSKLPDVTSIHVMTERVMVQLRADHPLADRSSLRLGELADTPFVSFSPEYSFCRWFEGICSLAGFFPTIFFEVCDSQSLMTIVKTHGVAALIPETTQYMLAMGKDADTRPADSEPIRAIPLEDTFCVRHTHLLYHNKRILTENVRQFLEYVLRFRTVMEETGDIRTTEEILLAN